MLHLLAVSEETTDIVTYVSIGAIAILILILAAACIRGKRFSTNEIAYAGVCLATSFALSFIKFSPVQYGGSITLCSFVPLLIYAYKFGPIKGTLAGLILGLFNFISDPFILTPLTFVLDYLLAFASIGLMGFAGMINKFSTTTRVVLGTVIVYVARFIFHLVSGFIYFAQDAIWVNLPQTNMFIYSFIYQCVYLPADCALCALALFALCKTKAFDTLLSMMSKKERAEVAEVAVAETPTVAEEKSGEVADKDNSAE